MSAGGIIPKYRMTTPQLVVVLRFHFNASRTPGDPDKRTVPARLLQLAADRLERIEQAESAARTPRLHDWRRSNRFAVQVCAACGIPKIKGGRNSGCSGKPQGERSAERAAAAVNGGVEA